MNALELAREAEQTSLAWGTPFGTALVEGMVLLDVADGLFKAGWPHVVRIIDRAGHETFEVKGHPWGSGGWRYYWRGIMADAVADLPREDQATLLQHPSPEVRYFVMQALARRAESPK